MNKTILAAMCSFAALYQTACADETEVSLEPDLAPVAAEEIVEEQSAFSATLNDFGFAAPDSAWRDLDPENTIYIDTVHGGMVVELYPEIAPEHAKRIKTLARARFYDGLTFHRVMKDFVNQTGDPLGNGTGDSALPDLKAEFTFKRTPENIPVSTYGSVISKMDAHVKQTGFYKALPLATKSDAAAFITKNGELDAYGLHCKGVASMARGGHSVDSGNSQFFLMRGKADHLDSEYSIWGSTIAGRDVLTKIKLGVADQTPGFEPDKMKTVRVVADLPEEERLNIQVLRSDGMEFAKYVDAQNEASRTPLTICDIELPTRNKP